MTRVRTVLLLASVIVVACGCTTAPHGVQQYGVMQQVMAEGQTQPRIALSDAVERPNGYAVGALVGLLGEVTIVDGDVWVTRVGDEGNLVTGSGGPAAEQATLLTLAHVDQWRSVPISQALAGDALEAFIETSGRSMGVDTTQPFPFVIRGKPEALELHVINGQCPIASAGNHDGAAPWHGTKPPDNEVTIVGFYAAGTDGVMTHHGTSIHAHAVLTLDGQVVTAHVDSVRVTSGMTLSIPGHGWPHRLH